MKHVTLILASVLLLTCVATAQNVGVGTTAPNSKLEVKGDSGDENSIGTLRLTNATGTTQLRFGTLDGTRSWIQSIGSLPLSINRLGNSTILNETAGSVGIGTPSPGQKLEVNGKILFHNGGITYNNPGVAELQVGYAFASAGTVGEVGRLALQPYGHTGGPFVFYNRDDASSAYLDIRYGSSNLLSIIHNGNVGLGTQNPSAKLHIVGGGYPQLLIEQASNHAILDIKTTDASPYEQGIRFFRNGVAQGEIYTINGDQKLRFYTNGADRMTIDNTGTVRIPALSATSAVYTDASSNLTTSAPATGTLGFWTRSGSNLFQTNLSDRVGIGVNTPQAILDVRLPDNNAGDAIAFGTQTYFMGRLGENAGTNTVYIANTYNSNSSFIDFRLKGKADVDSKMVIQGNGNVGIGTTSPGQKLDVQGGYIHASDVVGGASTTKAFMEGGSGIAYFGALGTQRAAFGNSENWETLVADDNNIGIGTSTPGVKLDIQSLTGVRIGYNNYDANLVFGNVSGWKSGIRVYDNAAAEMRIWHIQPSGKIILATGYNGDQATTLPSDGIAVNYNNLGVGTFSPGAKLDVQGITGVRIGYNAYDANLVFGNVPTWKSGIRVYDNGVAEMRIWHVNSSGKIFLSTGYNGDQATTLPSDGMVVNANKVGIGNMSPAYKLDVSGQIYNNVNTSLTSYTASNAIFEQASSSYNSALTLRNAYYSNGVALFGLSGGSEGLNVGRITSWGSYAPVNASAFNQISDITMKKDVEYLGKEDYDKCLTQIRNIQSIRFRYLSESATQGDPELMYRPHLHIGVVAQSLPDETTVPISADASVSNGEQKLGMSLGDMSGLLVAGMKALDAQNQMLQQKIDEMQKEIEELKKNK